MLWGGMWGGIGSTLTGLFEGWVGVGLALFIGLCLGFLGGKTWSSY
jgi:hypothetical protein